MSYCNLYYGNDEPYYSNFFRGFGLVLGPLIASNLLVYCPQFSNKFSEIYIIGISTSFIYTSYLNINNKYPNKFWNDFKNSFFITMVGSLLYFHPLSFSKK